eukprot:1503444-Pleurochrysis_carterae.AAC.2
MTVGIGNADALVPKSDPLLGHKRVPHPLLKTSTLCKLLHSSLVWPVMCWRTGCGAELTRCAKGSAERSEKC